MNTRHTPPTHRQIELARQKREDLEQQLREARKQENMLAATDEICNDPEYQKFLRVSAKLKARLHRIRMSVSKKRSSVEHREWQLDEVRKELKALEAEEKQRAREYAGIGKRLEAIRKALPDPKSQDKLS